MSDTEGKRMSVEEVECEAKFMYEEDENMTEEDKQMRQQWKSSRR
jgi:hypothetical protein